MRRADVVDVTTSVQSGHVPAQRTRSRAAGAAAAIHDIIDNRRVRALFHPLVRLATREVVGYEALSRGPDGSPLETPMAMLDAARAVGRLPELDWTCRAAAAEAALKGPYDPSLALFVNLEPQTLGVDCPEHLRSVIAAAGDRFRIVAEFTERALSRDPAVLLSAVAQVRANGWGVALDDVGAEPASLALLPFVHPDVIKLDLRLVQDRTDGEVASIANAVRAHSERTGAAILAEGIETPRHERVARVLGATFAQGWLYGRPAALPTVPLHTDRPLPRLAVAPVNRAQTPFDIVSEVRETARVDKRLLLPMSHHVEDQSLVAGAGLVVLGCFQESRHFTEATSLRYAALAKRAVFTAALAAGLPEEPADGVRGVALASGDRLRDEWTVIVVGAHVATALGARDCGDTGSDGDRQFDFVITHDRDLVCSAARAILAWISPAVI